MGCQGSKAVSKPEEKQPAGVTLENVTLLQRPATKPHENVPDRVAPAAQDLAVEGEEPVTTAADAPGAEVTVTTDATPKADEPVTIDATPKAEEPAAAAAEMPQAEEPVVADADAPEAEEPVVVFADAPEAEGPAISAADTSEAGKPAISVADERKQTEERHGGLNFCEETLAAVTEAPNQPEETMATVTETPQAEESPKWLEDAEIRKSAQKLLRRPCLEDNEVRRERNVCC